MGEPVKFDMESERELHDTAKDSALETFAKFARISNAVISDPNANINQDNITFTKYSKEQIVNFLQNVSSNAPRLRNASIYMADISSQYNRLLAYYANLYKYYYTVSPVKFNGNVTKTMLPSYYTALQLLEKLDIAHIAPIVLKVALREGVFFGARYVGDNAIYIQRINPDYCRITHIEDGIWQYSVDMSKIRKDKLILYPKEFETMYNRYLEGEGKWQPVPRTISFCLKADESIIQYCAPMFASTLAQLYDIETYKGLQKTGAELDNYKLLNMIIPMGEDSIPKIPFTTAEKFYNQLCENLPAYIGASMSPMEIQDFTFDKSSIANQTDIVSRAEDQYWSSNGTSALLHGSSIGDTAGAIKLAIKSDEAYMAPLIKQFESLVNSILRDQNSNLQKYKINILPVTIFNYDDMLTSYKEGATLGIPGAKSAYAALLGTPAYDIVGLKYIEDEFLKLDELTPLKSGYTMGDSSDVGRPTKSADKLTDAGQETQDTSGNENR